VEFAVLLDQLALALRALRVRQRGGLTLEALGSRLELGSLRLQILVALGELRLQLGLRGLGRLRLAQHAIGVHEADAKGFLCLRRHCAERKGRHQQCRGGTKQMVH